MIFDLWSLPRYKRAENLDGVLLENMRKPEFFNDKVR